MISDAALLKLVALLGDTLKVGLQQIINLLGALARSLDGSSESHTSVNLRHGTCQVFRIGVSGRSRLLYLFPSVVLRSDCQRQKHQSSYYKQLFHTHIVIC